MQFCHARLEFVKERAPHREKLRIQGIKRGNRGDQPRPFVCHIGRTNVEVARELMFDG